MLTVKNKTKYFFVKLKKFLDSWSEKHAYQILVLVMLAKDVCFAVSCTAFGDFMIMLILFFPPIETLHP